MNNAKRILILVMCSLVISQSVMQPFISGSNIKVAKGAEVVVGYSILELLKILAGFGIAVCGGAYVGANAETIEESAKSLYEYIRSSAVDGTSALKEYCSETWEVITGGGGSSEPDGGGNKISDLVLNAFELGMLTNWGKSESQKAVENEKKLASMGFGSSSPASSLRSIPFVNYAASLSYYSDIEKSFDMYSSGIDSFLSTNGGNYTIVRLTDTSNGRYSYLVLVPQYSGLDIYYRIYQNSYKDWCCYAYYKTDDISAPYASTKFYYFLASVMSNGLYRCNFAGAINNYTGDIRIGSGYKDLVVCGSTQPYSISTVAPSISVSPVSPSHYKYLNDYSTENLEDILSKLSDTKISIADLEKLVASLTSALTDSDVSTGTAYEEALTSEINNLVNGDISDKPSGGDDPSTGDNSSILEFLSSIFDLLKSKLSMLDLLVNITNLPKILLNDLPGVLIPGFAKGIGEVIGQGYLAQVVSAIQDILSILKTMSFPDLLGLITALPANIANALNNVLIEALKGLNINLDTINYMDILNNILENIKAVPEFFIIDVPAIQAHYDVIASDLADKSILGQYSDILNGFDFSDSYDYPKITMKVPEVLKPFYSGGEIVLIDFKDYAAHFVWVRGILNATLLFALFFWFIRQFKVYYHIG